MKKVQGDFKYLVDYMNQHDITIAQAAEMTDRTYSTVRNWLHGSYLKHAIVATEESQAQEERNVATLISKITGDSKEKVLDEIRNYFIKKGELELSDDTVFGAIEKLIKDIREGRVTHMFPEEELNGARKVQILTMLENDLKMMRML